MLNKLNSEIKKNQNIISETNKSIEKLGEKTGDLYRKLDEIQTAFDWIRGFPSDRKKRCDELKKIRLNWKQQVEKIEQNYKAAVAKKTSLGAAGAGVGVAMASMGPTAAMGVATTFGVASTGTAISSLSGAAATNAALAWLGGGALTLGGGGMAAGEALLALAGPVGWSIAAVSILASGVIVWKTLSDQNHIEEIFIAICDRDIKSYSLANIELKERMERIDGEGKRLSDAVLKIRSFGLDYDSMTEEQQYELGMYVNLMNSATQLLINPIRGIQPKYTKEDLDTFINCKDRKAEDSICKQYGTVIISLANLLYKINLNERDKKLLWKSMRNNKVQLSSMDISKKEFDIRIFDAVFEALDYKYNAENSL